jgi:dTDP-4-dehydrorhamnose 3,5-epimerase-like enzyme
MITKSSIYDCCIVELKKVHSRLGNITAVEGNIDIPFAVRRIYYLYDIPGGAERGGHAHKDLQQLIVAAGGCFDVVLDDGNNRKVVELNRPYYGLHVVPGIWREIINFSSGAICLVLASHKYDKDDYIRDYSNFIAFKNENSSNFRCTDKRYR